MKLLNESFDMNVEYDINQLDKQKLKIDKMMKEVGGFILEHDDEEIKIIVPKIWNESFQEIVNFISKLDQSIKTQVKLNIKRFNNNRNLK